LGRCGTRGWGRLLVWDWVVVGERIWGVGGRRWDGGMGASRVPRGRGCYGAGGWVVWGGGVGGGCGLSWVLWRGVGVGGGEGGGWCGWGGWGGWCGGEGWGGGGGSWWVWACGVGGDGGGVWGGVHGSGVRVGVVKVGSGTTGAVENRVWWC